MLKSNSFQVKLNNQDLTVAANIKPYIVGMYFGPKTRVAKLGRRTKLADKQEKSKMVQIPKQTCAPNPLVSGIRPQKNHKNAHLICRNIIGPQKENVEMTKTGRIKSEFQ